MSNTPFDPGTPSPAEVTRASEELAPTGATGATARRRRHRPASQRAVAPSGVAAPRVPEDEPAAPDASAAAEPAAMQPESEPATGRGHAAGRPRGGRRSGARVRAPQLVVPERGDLTPRGTGAPTDAPAAAAESAFATPAPLSVVPVLAEASALGALDAPTTSALPTASEPEGASPMAANGALETPADIAAGTPVRRYRFDRPAPRASAAPLRPERLNPASLQPEAPTASNGEESAFTSWQATSAATLTPIEAPPIETPPPASVEEPAPAVPDANVATTSTPPMLDESPSAVDGEETDGEEMDGGAAGQAEGADGATTRRRRRRRRSNGGNGTPVRHLETITPPEPSEPEPVSLTGRFGGGRAAEPLLPYEEPVVGSNNSSSAPSERQSTAPYGGPSQPYQMYAPYQQEPWDVSNPYEQVGQRQSPFGAPEPSPSRGFGPQPRGVAGPAPERLGRVNRGERNGDGISASQLGATLTQAIQQQTDRLLTELRHTQAPPSMTVMFPPFPSTERVGVFVDVANLLYSSRSLRIGLDFGRLLEFLRGNRRLVRAHAYAPTNPEPHAEQQFLSVVKGVGYRITTKNYKTFSSGAKKADLDLDMCMDIVRLVDAKALDTVSLVSGDSDFLPLLEYCSDHGVRVEVAAFDDSAAMILRQSCDLFINLSLVEDIRA